MALKFKILNQVPETWTPHTQYFIKNGNKVTTYITDANGVPFIVSKGDVDDSLEPLMFAGAE